MFRFKQFAIRQDNCPMKVGTDGVLLGAWTALRDDDRRLLDIGTGTGVIALMLAQRSAAHIEAVDIDPACVAQAEKNIAASPWSTRIGAICSAVQDFTPVRTYDAIVSNPPYFVDSLLPPDRGRAAARHAEWLPFAELADAVLRLLAPEGRFSLILPVAEAELFTAVIAGRMLMSRRTEVWSTPSSGAIRLLMEFTRSALQAGRGYLQCPEPECSSIVIESNGPLAYSDEYKALTCDFYLKF